MTLNSLSMISMPKNPKHIAIILDGNRRYAMRSGLKPWQGHAYGTKKVEELLEWCKDLGIKELTLYSFSSENFKRGKKEVDFLMNLFRKQIKRLKGDKRLQSYKLKVNFIGRLSLFPKDIQKEMEEVMEKTKQNKGFKVNFAMGYGGRAEIVDSIKKIIKKIKNKKINERDIDEKLIAQNLYLQDEPDIVIRPGGEKRVSNFFIWQSYYSEWFFIDKLWPEFTKQDLIEVIDEFKERERRFGG